MNGMRLALAGALAATAFVATSCYEVPEAERRTKEVVQDLVAREYGTASSRYRMFEEEVLSPEAAPTWRQALEHADATVREWAVDALSRIDIEEDLERVRERLDDPVRGVRTAAVSGLIRMDVERARADFVARLRSDSPDQVTLAAGGLVELDHRPGAALIVERFEDTSLPESTRAALTQPLAAIGDAAVVASLVRVALDTHAGPELRRLAAEAAFAVEIDGIADELSQLLDADDEYVRALAETMLAQ
jgi:HEAT repeat protein